MKNNFKKIKKFFKQHLLRKGWFDNTKKVFAFSVDKLPTTLEKRDKLKIEILELPEFNFEATVEKEKIKVEFIKTTRGIFSEWIGPDRSILRLVIGTKNEYRHPPCTTTFYCDKSFYSLISKTLKNFSKEKWGFELKE